MARNSWGSTRKLPSGRIQARYLGPDSKTYKAPDTFPDKLSALAWLGEVRKTIDLGSWEPPALKNVKVAVPTVGEAVEHWLSVMKAGVRDSTYATYSAIVANRVLNDDALCAVPVDRLTVAMVGEWWERTITRWPDTAPRNRSAYQKLRAAIALAVEYGHIDHNVVNLRAARRQVKPKAKGKYKGRKAALSPAQADELKAMREAGKSVASIAEHFGVSRQTVYNYS